MWLYHTTHHLTKKETPFNMVYGADVVFPIEIDTPTWHCKNFNEEENVARLRVALDMIDEARYITQIHKIAVNKELPCDTTPM